MNALRIVAIVLHFVVGVCGLVGCYAVIQAPQGPFGIPTDVLRNGPFTDFFIPGLTLFIVPGLNHIATGVVQDMHGVLIIARESMLPAGLILGLITGAHRQRQVDDDRTPVRD